MNKTKRILINLTNLIGNILFDEITPDESTCAYCWRRGYLKRVAVLDFIFGKNHCKNSYMNEKNGSHLAPEYRQ